MMKCSLFTFILFMSSLIQAADYTWDGGGIDHSWTTNENWVDDVAPHGPTGTGKVYLQSGDVEMDSDVDVLMTSHLCLGGAGTGSYGDATLTVNGGTLASSNGYILIGYNTTDTGTLIVNSGSLSVQSSNKLGLGIGWFGTGIVEINGGTINADRLMTSFKSDCPGGSSLAVHGGTVNITGPIRICDFSGTSATGRLVDTVVIDGGTVISSEYFVVGVHSKGTLSLSGTGDIQVADYFKVGGASYSEGAMTMSGGTLTCQNLIVGGDGEAVGTLDLTGGTITADTLTMNAGGMLNIAGGELVLDGSITDITSYGNVTADGGTGVLYYHYNAAENVTTITAVERSGLIVFVDANLSNTTINGNAPVNGSNYADGSNSIADNLWGTRSRSSVNGGYIWTTDAASGSIYAETTEPLVTTMTINGPAGEYRVFGLFYISQQGTSEWDCAFSLDGDTYKNYTKANATQAQASFFHEPVLTADTDGTGWLFIVQLGTVTTTAADQQVSVYVQGLDVANTDNRTWYEGVAYQDAAEEALITEPVVYPDEPNIQAGASGDVTLNKKDTGFRGVWYYISYGGDAGEYVYKYSGGLGTYCTRHRPLAVYRPEVDKTFFTYGGTSATSNEQLWHMVSCYDHQTGQVSMPTLLLDKKTNDAHDNPVMSMDDDGHVWIFSTSHGTGRPSYIHKSKQPYDINEFELVASTKIDAGNNVVPFTNFSYFQPWSDGADGFSAFLTIYQDPVERTIQFMKTTDGVNWSKAQKISIAGRGAYQMSGQFGSKLATAFNYHPNGEQGRTGVDWRTNLYYVQTLDNGATWQTVDGTPVALPLDTPDVLTSPMLVRNYMTPTWRNVYLNDIVFDDAGHPVITYITTASAKPGPDGGPRYWEFVRWNGTQWVFGTIGEVDHGFDGGTLYLEADGTWRVIGNFVGGPQPYGTGGELEMYTSSDQGAAWTKVMDVTSNSLYNHTHIRRPLNAAPDFYGFWADGHSRMPSESNLYYCDKAGNVTKLPRGTGPAANSCDLLGFEDINHDCDVNLKDLAAVAENWQAEGSCQSSAASNYTGPGIDDSFEVDSVDHLPYSLSGTPPVVSTDCAFSGSKSLQFQAGFTGTYALAPFADQSLSNVTVSARVYLPTVNAAGRACLSVEDEAAHEVTLIIDRDAEGSYDVLHRVGSIYTRPIENVAAGWHQLGFAVYANNAVGVYFDDQYLTTATNFTTGVNTVKFGKPWEDAAGIELCFDDLKVACNTDAIGGGSASPGDLYEDFEYHSAEGFGGIGGYAYTGNPTFSNVLRRSTNCVLCTANTNSTKMTKTLASAAYNARLSAWIYVPYLNSGQGYLRATSLDGKYVFIGVNPNPDRVYYRFEADVNSGFAIDKGWHLMSIITDYQGHFHLLFDNHFLGTYTDSTGLSEISFGNPWSTAGYVAYDCLTLVSSIRGGFTGDWNTIYASGDFSRNGCVDTDDLVQLANKWLGN